MFQIFFHLIWVFNLFLHVISLSALFIAFCVFRTLFNGMLYTVDEFLACLGQWNWITTKITKWGMQAQCYVHCWIRTSDLNVANKREYTAAGRPSFLRCCFMIKECVIQRVEKFFYFSWLGFSTLWVKICCGRFRQISTSALHSGWLELKSRSWDRLYWLSFCIFLHSFRDSTLNYVTASSFCILFDPLSFKTSDWQRR